MKLFKITLFIYIVIWGIDTLAQNNDTGFETILCFFANEQKKCYQLEIELTDYNENSHTISSFPINDFPTREMIQMVIDMGDTYFYDPVDQIAITRHLAEEVDARSFCQSANHAFKCFYLTEQ